MNHQLPREVQVMKRTVLPLLLVLSLFPALSARAQTARLDAIWARTTTDTIVLDGVLDEAAWAAAETWNIQWGQDAGIPGSGFKVESGHPTSTDPTNVTLKFLIKDNQLYLGADVPDASVGGAAEFNRFDGLLMSMKNHADSTRPPSHRRVPLFLVVPRDWPDPQPGAAAGLHRELGRVAPRHSAHSRADRRLGRGHRGRRRHQRRRRSMTGYTIEMRFNLTPMGYDVTVARRRHRRVEHLASTTATGSGPSVPLQLQLEPRLVAGALGQHLLVQRGAHPRAARCDHRPPGPCPIIAPEIVVPSHRRDSTHRRRADRSRSGAMPRSTASTSAGATTPCARPTTASAPAAPASSSPRCNGGEAFVLDPADATVKVYHRATCSTWASRSAIRWSSTIPI